MSKDNDDFDKGLSEVLGFDVNDLPELPKTVKKLSELNTDEFLTLVAGYLNQPESHVLSGQQSNGDTIQIKSLCL